MNTTETKKISKEDAMWDIAEIIEKEAIEIYFQPIVSTYQERVAGIEALVRGIDKAGQTISPGALFSAANEADLVIELDRLCQEKAMEAFGEIICDYADLILFMNVDNSVIHLHSDEEAIYDYAIKYQVPPSRVVLEINELQRDDHNDMSDVLKFATKYRERGFIISVDDIGAGFSNLDRIAVLKPAIIKIDRELIRHIDRHYYKQQTVDMLCRLGEKIGSLIVAEGVETIEEIMMVLQFGAHLLQGFYISKPMPFDINHIMQLNESVKEITGEQGALLSDYLVNKCDLNKRLRQHFNDIRDAVEEYNHEDIEAFLKVILTQFEQIECAYIIDLDGYQITDTIFNGIPNLRHRALFNPYKQGDNAKLKAYFYVLRTTYQDLYISDEYLSLATGSKCITISGYVTINDEQCILCLDITS